MDVEGRRVVRDFEVNACVPNGERLTNPFDGELNLRDGPIKEKIQADKQASFPDNAVFD